jgi:hypothetical protein
VRFDTLLISIETMDTAKVLFDLKLVHHSKKIPGGISSLKFLEFFVF